MKIPLKLLPLITSLGFCLFFSPIANALNTATWRGYPYDYWNMGPVYADTYQEACQKFWGASYGIDGYYIYPQPYRRGCLRGSNIKSYAVGNYCLTAYQFENVPQCINKRMVARAKGKPNCPAGNPVSISTGNKFQHENVFNQPIIFNISYNSNASVWRHSYSYRLNVTEQTALLVRPDGKGLTFNLLNNLWTTTDADVFSQVIDLGASKTPRWKVTTPEGNTELYNGVGQLISITSLSGDTTTLSYSDSTTTVANHLGDTLVLTNDANGNLSSALLNNEISHSFNFDAEGRLLSRTDNEGNTTQYHYEDTRFPKHLTGITGPDGKRFASWAYDDQGRGIMSEHAGQEHVELVFNTDGSTTVTNELGKQTTYHFTEIEGLKRPTLIEGHATANCVGSNKAYTYYPSGLLETKTDWAGNTIRYEYNDRGLITLIAEAEGSPQERITTQVWDSTKPLLLERVQGSQRTRFSYNSTNQLIDTTKELSQ